MIWTIVKKELLENLLNQRFAISLVLVTLISWTSTFVLTKNYNEEVNDYYQRVNFQDRMIDDYFHMAGWDGSLMMPPKPPPILSSLARGVRKDWGFGSLDENPVPILFPFMDILFVIGIIISIASLTLSYDSISGEKELGTLKMLVIGLCGRGKILFGKWLGGLLSVLLILLIAVLGSVLIAYSLSQSSWTVTEWSALAALLVLSALYCASFHSIGFYISAKSSSASDSMIISLLSWVLLTLILPTIPPYLAEAMSPAPSPAKVQYEVFFTLKQQEDNAIEAIRAPYKAKGMNENEIREITKPEVDKIVAEYEKKADELKQSALRKSAVREGITALLHFLSPFSSYALAGAELTATGALNQLYFVDKAQRYLGILYRDYLPRKIEEAKSKNPNYTQMTKLDIQDRPRFGYREENISYRLVASAIHTVFILIYTFLFLILAWRAFVRYDVR
ncbi:MAG: ABC transporter permease subunit [Bacteroidota bacterium]